MPINNDVNGKGPVSPYSLRSLGKRALRLIAELSGRGLGQISTDGRLLGSNPRFNRIFGADPDLSKNEIFCKLFGGTREEINALLRSIDVKISGTEVAVHLEDGRTLYFDYEIERIKGANLAIEIADVTEKVEARKAREEKERPKILAGENIHILFHQLRNSVGMMGMGITAMEERLDLETVTAHLPAVATSYRRIKALMEGTLQIGSKKERQFTEVDLARLAEETQEMGEIARRLMENKIQFILQGTCRPIEGAGFDLKEALVCLIHNAIDAIVDRKISDGKITIAFREEPEKKSVVCSVADNGIGISPEGLSRIWEWRYTTKSDGTGIGLTTVTRAIEHTHGGNIEVKSRFGEGSEFTFYLPFSHRKTVQDAERVPTGETEKLNWVREKARKMGLDMELAEKVIASMEIDHVRTCTPQQILAQIEGMILRLKDYQKSGQLHISANNFAPHSEVVFAGDKDSAPARYGQSVIYTELKKLKIEEVEFARAADTRKLEVGRAICRVFEIRLKGGRKLTEEDKDRLEKALQKKLTPLPTKQQLEDQLHFVKSAHRSLSRTKGRAQIHSLIFRPAVKDGALRLVGYRMKTHPSDEAIEEGIRGGRLDLRETAAELLGFHPDTTFTSATDMQLLVKKDLPDFPANANLGDLSWAHSFRLVLFRMPDDALVVNALFSSLEKLSDPRTRSFVANNMVWKSSQHD